MDELSASESFFARHGSNYWDTLIETEISGNARHIGKVGTTHWIAPFVSLGMLGEVMCIFPDVFSLSDFREEHINDLVSGLARVFQFYENEGIFSFNASLSFGPKGQGHFNYFFQDSAEDISQHARFCSGPEFFPGRSVRADLPRASRRSLQGYTALLRIGTFCLASFIHCDIVIV